MKGPHLMDTPSTQTPRTSVVVGGATGIGAATTSRLLSLGDTVLVVDRVAPGPTGATYVECDLLDEARVAQVVEELPMGIGAVAYVAGIPGTRPAPDVLTVNFLAMRQFLQALSPKLLDGGAIVVVTSLSGAAWRGRRAALAPLLATSTVAEGVAWLEANPSDYPVYETSKEAAILFAKTCAPTLWAGHRIRVNTVSPGPVETGLLAEFEQSYGKDELDGLRQTFGRHAVPDDIASVVTAVLSKDFGWVNGHDLQVDGGAMNTFDLAEDDSSA
ncbi:putative Short chain dehydrogenase family protein [metagenome]|uniref:Putative Short chain dehydrogenase family protein n=1 Tax=metagenome TaxID=256318 RepID=A0A2P2C8L9_9ZZZZ